MTNSKTDKQNTEIRVFYVGKTRSAAYTRSVNENKL
jgi:hypothetical protein